MLNKLVSITAILLLYVASLPSKAEDKPEVFLYDDFSTYVQNGAPPGWTVSNPDMTFPVQTGNAQGTAVKLVSTNEVFDANMQIQFQSIKGRIVLEAKTWVPDVLHRRTLFIMKDYSAHENVLFMFNSNGYITLSSDNLPLMMYYPEKWYYFQLVLDTEKKSYDLYINNKEVLKDKPLPNQEFTDLSLLRFGQWDRDKAYFYIDDITVYKSDGLLTQQELKDAYAIKYNDIKGNWAQKQIEYMATRRMLPASDDGNFYPDNIAKRKDFIIMAYYAFRYPLKSYGNGYMDVQSTDSYADWLQSCTDAGVVSGYGGYFNPENPITVLAASKILVLTYRNFKQKLPGDGELKFTDQYAKGEWADDYIGQAKYMGLYDGVYGINKENLEMNAFITKAQAAVLIKNLNDYMLKH